MEKTIWGTVISVNIKGHLANSAQLLFAIESKDKREKKSIVVLFQPTHEPQVFAAMASFVTAAYFGKQEIGVGYLEITTIDGVTNEAIEVYSPKP